MEKRVVSRYNYYFSEDGKYLVYNSLTGAISCVSEHTFHELKNNNGKELENCDRFLLEKGFVLDASKGFGEQACALGCYQNIEKSRRLQLAIIVTGKCNLRCVYCYEKFDKPKMSEGTQEEIVSYLKNTLPKYDSLYVGWFGGEPLLALDVIEVLSNKIITLCQSLKKMYYASITTNGVLLTRSYHKVLDRCKVDMFQITLDGGPEIHDRQRVTPNGMGSYDKIYKNLLEMRNSDFRFIATIRINIAKSTTINDAFKAFFKQLYSDFGKDPRFNLHLAAVSDLAGEQNGSTDICSTYHLAPYYMEAQKAGFEFSRYKSLFKPAHLVCYAANPNAYVIDADATVHKCTVGLYDERNCIGYIKQGIMVLDKEKENLWYEGIPSTKGKCTSCELLPTCLGRFCPLERIQQNEIVCPPMKENLDMYMRIFLNESKTKD